ncbi:hypothetical protein [Pseudidiomarina sediminum]|uniref:hypothetical protein n=1 Tax=Pseudidiomarina sediminum TaxID=431675 RepID=UPI001C958268|nr:hypothetical protein [Pseudidiomarina sediminum]MBY6064099.1 hypothetical protein [Pseudidiomarina sediminum]
MKKSAVQLLAVALATALAGCSAEQPEGLAYYETIMKAPPLLPEHATAQWLDCAPSVDAASADYTSVADTGTALGWVDRAAHDWDYFSSSADDGKVLVIDYAQKGDALAFRYLANDNTHADLYEPWSSSKIMAYAGALSLVSENFAQADTLIGDTKLADLITSIHSYQPSGKADGNSNAIAYYFADVAGRDYLTGLFHQGWMNSGQDGVMFRGKYGPDAFVPSDAYWRTPSRNAEILVTARSEDAGLLDYNCESCGELGNKPMTTLTSAEFLKRLVTQQRVPETRLAGLSDDAVMMLLYGPGHSDNSANAGGMMAGAGLGPHRAIARALQQHYSEYEGLSAQETLDQATQGNWRIFHKLGAGPSGTRGTSEVVALAHVCLPLPDGTHEFTLAAQAAVDDNSYENVGYAGEKLERLLETTVATLLAEGH